MQNIGCIKTILILLLLTTSLCVESYAADRLPMPKGLEGVYLGMSLDELKKIKPNIIKDDWPRSPVYFEKDLDNTFFSSVVYRFSKHRWFSKSKLEKITLEGSETPELIKGKISGLIKGCIKKWGSDYNKKIGIGRTVITKEIRYSPILYWQKANAVISVTYGKQRYSIYILDPTLKPRRKFKEPVDPKELEEMFKDLPIAETYNGPVFE